MQERTREGSRQSLPSRCFMIHLGQEQVHLNGHLGQKMMHKQLSKSTDIFLPKVTTPPPPTFLSAQMSLSSGTIPSYGSLTQDLVYSPQLGFSYVWSLGGVPGSPLHCKLHEPRTWSVFSYTVSSQLHHQEALKYLLNGLIGSTFTGLLWR